MCTFGKNFSIKFFRISTYISINNNFYQSFLKEDTGFFFCKTYYNIDFLITMTHGSVAITIKFYDLLGLIILFLARD